MIVGTSPGLLGCREEYQVDDAELERTLRNHLFRDNPNPERVGCPTPEEIRILAYDPQTLAIAQSMNI